MHSLVLFAGLAVLVTLTPGPATAMLVRSALRGGRRAALLTTCGNSVGIFCWGIASAIGVSALISASEAAFVALKVSGGVVLMLLGIQSLRRRGRPPGERGLRLGGPFREGVVTSLANPKLAIFFVALFPQFLERGHSTVLLGLAMAATIVSLDLIWFSTLAFVITRAKSAVAERWGRRIERLTGGAMIGLGLRVALETR
jgi:threonine/homoserine/homoserine lactone efflux protein